MHKRPSGTDYAVNYNDQRSVSLDAVIKEPTLYQQCFDQIIVLDEQQLIHDDLDESLVTKTENFEIADIE